MTARGTDEPHRASSQLELLFDLTFVAAISGITAQLAGRIANGDGLQTLTPGESPGTRNGEPADLVPCRRDS
jgi:hypothetical protein